MYSLFIIIYSWAIWVIFITVTLSMARNEDTRIRKKFWLLTYPQCGLPIDVMKDALYDIPDMHINYMCICQEHHQGGEPHRHVFLSLDEAIRLRRDDMRTFDIQGYHCNIEASRSPKKALQYVKKDGQYQEFGCCPFIDSLSTSQKNKILIESNIVDLIDEGQISLLKLPQLSKALNIYKDAKTSQLSKRAPEVLWFYGEAGSGKTRKAVQMGEERGSYWISNGDLQWFDGYDDQKVVILDDIRCSSCRFNFLLRLLDRYKVRVPIKGGFKEWNPETIIITAPGKPEEVFKNRETGEAWESIDQLIRRISRMEQFTNNE